MHKHTVFTDDLNQECLRLGRQPGGRLFLLADAWVAENYSNLLDRTLFEDTYLLKGGEATKCIENVISVCHWLQNHYAERSSVLVVMGGGSILDMGGLAAALYKRGMRLIFIPTTLMSMVDAAIGGKNAVNSGAGKNMLGTFYPPDYILSDIRFLSSLPIQEIISGWVEMFKHALISGGDDWREFLNGWNPTELPPARIIERSAMIKAQISSADERENANRMVLNFGHTIGHALEAYFIRTPKPQTHGACVAIGMIAEIRLAMDLGKTNHELGEKLIELLSRVEWVDMSTMPDFTEIADYLNQDKKIRAGHFNLVAFESPGAWCLFRQDNLEPIERAYRSLKEK